MNNGRRTRRKDVPKRREEESTAATAPPFPPSKFFGRDVRRYLSIIKEEEEQQQQRQEKQIYSGKSIDFDDVVLRQVMEPHIDKARRGRAKASAAVVQSTPYPTLRSLQRLHFSQEQFPFRQSLETLLGTHDLAQLHTHDAAPTKKEVLKPLLEASTRGPFHEIYERFMQNFIIPYLHKRSIANRDNENTFERRLLFRYQTFPCVRVVRPGEFSIGPHCDLAYGHSVYSLNFYLPLSTPIEGTNAVHVETEPGREDWQPLLYQNGDVGVAVLFNGVECLHFTLENTTPFTRVSLDFRVSFMGYHDVQALEQNSDWQDRYSSPDGYYAFCESSQPDDGSEIEVQRLGERSDSIDRRVGFPF